MQVKTYCDWNSLWSVLLLFWFLQFLWFFKQDALSSNWLLEWKLLTLTIAQNLTGVATSRPDHAGTGVMACMDCKYSNESWWVKGEDVTYVTVIVMTTTLNNQLLQTAARNCLVISEGLGSRQVSSLRGFREGPMVAVVCCSSPDPNGSSLGIADSWFQIAHSSVKIMALRLVSPASCRSDHLRPNIQVQDWRFP